MTTPHDFTPGAVAYQLGLSEPAATILQWACVVATAVVTAYAWWRASAEVAYVVTIVASQLVSPVLWDHYAILLLLPVACASHRFRVTAAMGRLRWLGVRGRRRGGPSP